MGKIRENLVHITFYTKQICKHKKNRCLAVLAPVITGAAPVSGCHLMLPSGGPGAWSQRCPPAPSVKGGLRACRAKGEGAELPSTLLDSEDGL